MLTDADIERRCRYRLAKHGLRMKKVRGNYEPVYYFYEINGDNTQPDDDPYAWHTLMQVLDYCEKLAEEDEERAYRKRHGF